MRNPLAWGLAMVWLPISLAAQAPRRSSAFESWSGGLPGSLAAIVPQGAAGSSARQSHAVRWYEAAAALGVIAGTGLLDGTVRDYSQDHRSGGRDDVARLFRRMGQPEVYATVGLGTLAAGLIAGDDGISRAGGRITASLLVAGASNSIIKRVVGRKRPSNSTDPDEFKPLSRHASFPSGHTAMAFALAASVSNEVHFWPAQVGLYSAATMTGWSRINDNKHWLSDVVGGAAVGITSAMVMDGRWKIFGLGQPHFLAGPGGGSVSMSIAF